MPRPKKITQEPEIVLSEETITETPDKAETPPSQYLKPYFIEPLVEDEKEISVKDIVIEEKTFDVDVTPTTKFNVHKNEEFIETVDDNSEELEKYLELNKKELNERIEDLWQVPKDPNDLIFFNFGEQKMIYRTYDSYFTINGFAPVEPKITSWMQYYLKKHYPITPEEVAILLKGSLQYSFIPIKS